MTYTKSIVLTFFNFWETTDASDLSVRVKNIPSTGQYFMPVSLMTHIPHYPVVRCIKDIMKRHS